MRFYTPSRLGSKRSVTPEGFLVCLDVPIARTGEMLYAPGEIEGLAPGPDGLVHVIRDAAQVFDPASMASFAGKPTTNDHPPEMVGLANYRRYTCGATTNVHQGSGSEADLLLADLMYCEPDAIAAINGGKIEISNGYDAEYEEVSPGVYRQYAITGNHVALVDDGRCGTRCSIRDAAHRDAPDFREEDHPRGEGGQFTAHQQKMHKLADHLDRMGSDDRYGSIKTGVTEEVYNRHRALAGDVKVIGKHADAVQAGIAQVGSPTLMHDTGIADEIKDGIGQQLKDSASEVRSDMRDPDLKGFQSQEETHIDIRPHAKSSAAAIRQLADEGSWIERTKDDGDSDLHPDDLDALADHSEAVNRVLDDFLSTVSTSAQARHRTGVDGKREVIPQVAKHASEGSLLSDDLRGLASDIRAEEEEHPHTHDARRRNGNTRDHRSTSIAKRRRSPGQDKRSLNTASPCGCGDRHHGAAASATRPARSLRKKAQDMATKPIKLRGSMLDRIRRAVAAKDEAGFEEAMGAVETAAEENQEQQAQAELVQTIGTAVAEALAPVLQRMDGIDAYITDRKAKDAAVEAAKGVENKPGETKLGDGKTADDDAISIGGEIPTGAGADAGSDSGSVGGSLRGPGPGSMGGSTGNAGGGTEDSPAGDPSSSSISEGDIGSNGGVANGAVEPAYSLGVSPLAGGKGAGTSDSSKWLGTFRDTVARAEMLAPGVRLPTFDAKAAPKATADAVCALRRRALKTALDSDDRRGHVRLYVTDAAALDTMSCDTVRMAFLGASEAVKAANAPGARRGAFDAIAPATGSIKTMADKAKKLWG